MSRRSPKHAPKPTPPSEPGRALRALAATLARLLKPAPTLAWTVGPDGAPLGGAPLPGSAWERNTERRLSIIEKTLNNQNRLLLLTLVSVVADVVIGATK
jgi:hypothetical protein